jgi:heme-degrading monooxygenase HmoA
VFARSTTVAVQQAATTGAIAFVRDEVMPGLANLPGYIGLSLLLDRDSRRSILTSAWETEEAMRSGAEQMRGMQARAATFITGDRQIDEWEIAVLHRDHRSSTGACVRATWLRTRPELFANALEFYRSAVLPVIEEFDGFCSASLMIDRDSGRAVTSTTFDTVEAMELSRDRARSLRTEQLRNLGADQLDVGEFALELAHLRVPETV